MRANLDAFRNWRLRPRMLTGNVTRDLSVEVLGLRSPAPFLLAPVGVLSIAHAEAEVGWRGCGLVRRADGALERRDALARRGRRDRRATLVPALLGLGPRDLRELRQARRRTPATARSSSRSTRSRSAGVHAICGNAYLPFLQGEGCGQFFTDPVFLARLDKPPEEDVLAAAAMMLATFPNLGLTWDDLDWLRAETTLPLLVKGVLTSDDAASRWSTASTASSSRTMAGGRSTAPSPPSMHLSRCVTRCPTPSC